MAKILTIIPYEFYPPRYGGALRCFYLLKEMAKCHEVILLTVQPMGDFINTEAITFPANVRIISMHDEKGYRSVFNIFPNRVANAINSRIIQHSLFKKGNLLLLKSYPLLKRFLTSDKIDLVNYETLECFSLLRPYVRKHSPSTRHLYDAHNVDSELWLQQAKMLQLPHLMQYAEGALFAEKLLYKTADICFCCSDIDKNKLLALNNGKGKFCTIPNGVNIKDRPFDENPDKHSIQTILFCGTLDYAPNIEGVLWFYKEVFPLVKRKFPQLKFTVIGKMDSPGPYADLIADPSVNFVGFVPDVVPYYLNNSVFVVPLFSGSGTRLKILEAMSMGNPIVSTGIGAEGLGVVQNEHIKLADDQVAFANAVVELLSCQKVFNTLREAANAWVKKQYDWETIGANANSEITSLLR